MAVTTGMLQLIPGKQKGSVINVNREVMSVANRFCGQRLLLASHCSVTKYFLKLFKNVIEGVATLAPRLPALRSLDIMTSVGGGGGGGGGV